MLSAQLSKAVKRHNAATAKAEDAERKATERSQQNEAGTLALLHDRIYQACNYYIGRGWITASDLKNLDYMYVPYHALGGNGVCTTLIDRCRRLEIRPEE